MKPLRITICMILAILVYSHQSIAQKKSEKLVAFYGEFSNMKFTQEHQYGYEVQLWNDSGSFIGFLFHSNGLIGDAPIGVLENVNHDIASGNISFESTLTMGLHYCRIHNGIPSRQVYRFKGVLSKSNIAGEMIETNTVDQNIISNSEKVDLLPTKESGMHDRAAITRNEWNKKAIQILKTRGPQW